jgi:hypothetical protein|mmetsp:Transcript_41756/g.70464  ORF Transcript_41756/g.70464 Transcript_41756/m.70464 type:complete len:244 (-) Transcript_41756:2529-3260(-)
MVYDRHNALIFLRCISWGETSFGQESSEPPLSPGAPGLLQVATGAPQAKNGGPGFEPAGPPSTLGRQTGWHPLFGFHPPVLRPASIGSGIMATPRSVMVSHAGLSGGVSASSQSRYAQPSSFRTRNALKRAICMRVAKMGGVHTNRGQNRCTDVRVCKLGQADVRLLLEHCSEALGAHPSTTVQRAPLTSEYLLRFYCTCIVIHVGSHVAPAPPEERGWRTPPCESNRGACTLYPSCERFDHI